MNSTLGQARIVFQLQWKRFYTTKVMVAIAFGLLVAFIPAVIFYFASHGSVGVSPTVVLNNFRGEVYFNTEPDRLFDRVLTEKLNGKISSKADFFLNKTYNEPIVPRYFVEYNPRSRNYTITKKSFNSTLNDIYYCHGSRSCDAEIKNAWQDIALLKFYIDTGLAGINQTKSPFQVKEDPVGYISNQVVLWDVFFFFVGTQLVFVFAQDRQKGLKYSLYTAGLSKTSYVLGFFAVPGIFVIPFMILAYLVTMSLWGSAFSDPSVLILILCSAIVVFGLIWVLFELVHDEKVTLAVFSAFILFGNIGMIVGLLFGGSYFIQLSPAVITALCLHPSFASYFYTIVARKLPLQDSFPYNSVLTNLPSVTAILATCLFSACLIILLVVYIDWLEVGENERRPFHHLFSQFFKKDAVIVSGSKIDDPKIQNADVIDSLPDDQKVLIQNVSKSYPHSSTVALSNINFEFGKGEIFGLLGFNGAGKSTLINILCGKLHPSSGNCSIFGLEPANARDKIGFVSQNDNLFNELSVYDHLFYIGLIKGIKKEEITQNISFICDELALDKDTRSKLPSELSGGQKRRLCLAMAFINDPELAIVDEVTSGIDPENRRIIWKFLKSRKDDCAIMISTHFMDEADILAERKALLMQGHVLCVGDSSFLKTVYSSGYCLTVEISEEFDEVQFNSWFASRNTTILKLKESGNHYSYELERNAIAVVVSMERNRSIASMIKSYTIREQGLEVIFSRPELRKYEPGNLSKEQTADMLSYFNSFQSSSITPLKSLSLVCYFELKRFYSAGFSLILRLLPVFMAMLAMFLFVPKSNFGKIVLNLDQRFKSELETSGFKFVSTNEALIGNYSSKIGKIGTVKPQFTIGTINADSALVDFNYPAAPFVALDILYPQLQNQTTSVEFVSGNDTLSAQNMQLFFIGLFYLFAAAFILEEIRLGKMKFKNLFLAAKVSVYFFWWAEFIRDVLLWLGLAILLAIGDQNVNFVTHAFCLVALILFCYLLSDLDLRKSQLILTVLYIGYINRFTAFIESWFSTGTIFKGSAVIFALLVLNYLVEFQAKYLPQLESKETAEVSFEHLSKKYLEESAVNDVTFTIGRNEMIAIVGKNGSGKTTTLRMLEGDIVPTSGAVFVDSVQVATNKYDTIQKLGICPQFDDFLVPTMRVVDVLLFICNLQGIAKDVSLRYIDLLLCGFGISAWRDCKCGQLSGGTKRKVSACIAMMFPKSVVILDEPSTGLDPLARGKLWDMAKLLGKDCATIMTTHYINETSVCDKIAVLSHGALKYYSTEYDMSRLTVGGYQISLQFDEPRLSSHVDALILKHIILDSNATYTVEDFSGSKCLLKALNYPFSAGHLISILLELKETKEIVDFGISMLALEEAYLDLTSAENLE